MPASALALVSTFVASAIGIACGVTYVVGPRRPTAAIVPSAAAVGALSLVGHGVKPELGPTMTLYGYQVNLPFDLALAFVVALATALIQRAVLERRAAR
jgi:hypothetical protein